MSYILDALKKSEKERMRKSAPDILSVQETILHEKKKKKNIWIYLIITVLLANLLISGYWLFHSEYNPNSSKNNVLKNTENVDIPEQKIERLAESDMNKPYKTKQIESDNSDFSIKNKKSDIAERTILTEGTELKKKPENAKTQTVKSEKREGQNTSEKEIAHDHEKSTAPGSLPVNKEPAPEQNKLYSINELPPSLKESLPPINMTIFMYSEDPASRMVRINGQTLREGQHISEGVKLEEIRSDGIIVSYKNYKMHIGQKQQ